MFEQYIQQESRVSVSHVVPGFQYNTLQSYEYSPASQSLVCRGIAHSLRAIAKKSESVSERRRALIIARQYQSKSFHFA
jgi:hypothetical protein